MGRQRTNKETKSHVIGAHKECTWIPKGQFSKEVVGKGRRTGEEKDFSSADVP